MGLREDISAAISSITSALPDAAVVMRHGDAERGSVVYTSAHDISTEPISADAPQEVRRVIGRRADFPTLDKGSLVEIGSSYQLVTSLATDPVGASVNFGISKPFDDLVSTYSGKRREDGKVRQIKSPVRILALLTSTSDEYSEVAMSSEDTWTVCIAEETWLELSEPQIADTLEFIHPRKRYETVTLKVSSVVKHTGWWMLKARTRGGV